MAYPDWVLQHRQKGQEIKRIGTCYYLYEVSSFYDKEKKKTRKKSGTYLGRITEDGFIPKGEAARPAIVRSVSVKEVGASNLVQETLTAEAAALTKHLPDYAQEILVCVIYRLLYQSSFKRMSWHHESSYLSETYPNLRLSGKQISEWLPKVGQMRDNLVAVMKELMDGEELLLIDSTHIKTLSSKNVWAQLGYNSQQDFEPQVNLLFLFAHDQQMPIFYRCVAGNVREIRAMELTLKESGIQNSVLVSDKGFYSASNLAMLQQNKWQYVLPLRRNLAMCDYSPLQQGSKKGFDGFFMYQKRPIWYKVSPLDGEQAHQRLILFFDERLKTSETSDYLTRVSAKKEGYSLEQFHEKEPLFGTLTVLTNTAQKDKEEQTIPSTPKKVYEFLKSRNDIEQLNDSYKNVLRADVSYTQSDASMEAWHFINFLAIRAYYKIFAMLVSEELSERFSPSDLLLALQAKKKVKINDDWVDSEVPKKLNDIINMCLKNKKQTHEHVT